MTMDNEPAGTMSDEEMLASVMSERAGGKPAEDDSPEPELQQAAVEPEAKAEEPVAAQAKDEALVPSHRLREEAEARRVAEAEREELRRIIAQMQAPRPQPAHVEPSKPIELFDDPSGFVREAVNPAMEEIRQAQMFNARLIAETRFGPEKVAAATEAYDAELTAGRIHPDEHARLLKHPNPFAAAIDWHQRHSTLKEVGTDPAAYRAKIEAETRAKLEADPEFTKSLLEKARAQAVQSGNTVARSPSITTPSLSRVGSAALQSQSESEWNDEVAIRKLQSTRRRGG